MAWETIVAGVVILSLAVLWYGLQAVALRDLHTRPRVRGDNKLLWAFAILCVPYLGALGYLSMGPTSFLPRTSRGRSDDIRTTRRPARPARPVVPTAMSTSNRRPLVPGPVARDVHPGAAPRSGARSRVPAGLAVDPIIGTDSADLMKPRPSSARRTRPVPMPDAIRWPGSGVSPGWQSADAELHD